MYTIITLFIGQNVATLRGHTGEVVVNQFGSGGSTVITGSFDNTIKIWDIRTARLVIVNLMKLVFGSGTN